MASATAQQATITLEPIHGINFKPNCVRPEQQVGAKGMSWALRRLQQVLALGFERRDMEISTGVKQMRHFTNRIVGASEWSTSPR